jgi:aminoglycoside phosphotransferase (APT) family kinase protein
VTPEHEVLPGVRAAELAAYLQRWLDAPAPLALESVLLAGQGMSDDTILVEAVDAAGARHSLALRRYRPEGILREFVDPARHFRTLAALGATSVPAPRALWFDPDSALLGGACFAMERVAGQVPIPWSPE